SMTTRSKITGNKREPVTIADQKAILGSLSQGTAAWLVGMSPRAFRDLDVPRKKSGAYDARALIEWARSAAGDPLLTGNDSASLERYRLARAESAELDLAERRGRLVDCDALAEWWMVEIAAPIRRAIATLQARFGPDAAAMIVAALEKSDRAI